MKNDVNEFNERMLKIRAALILANVNLEVIETHLIGSEDLELRTPQQEEVIDHIFLTHG